MATPGFDYRVTVEGVAVNPYTNQIDLRQTPMRGVIRDIDRRPGSSVDRAFDDDLRAILIPPIRAEWPRRTGYSGDGFEINAGVITNRADYAPRVEARTGVVARNLDASRGEIVAGLEGVLARQTHAATIGAVKRRITIARG